jgi:hypothetical protein
MAGALHRGRCPPCVDDGVAASPAKKDMTQAKRRAMRRGLKAMKKELQSGVTDRFLGLLNATTERLNALTAEDLDGSLDGISIRIIDGDIITVERRVITTDK